MTWLTPDNCNPFTLRFLATLRRAGVNKVDNAIVLRPDIDPAAILLVFPSEDVQPERLTVATFGGSVTMSLGGWHAHFSEYEWSDATESGPPFDQAIQLISELLDGKKVIVEWLKGGHVVAAGPVAANAVPGRKMGETYRIVCAAHKRYEEEENGTGPGQVQ